MMTFRSTMNRAGMCVAIATALALAVPVTADAATGTQEVAAQSVSQYFVSPSGSDSAAGTKSAPFRSLDKARDVVRSLKAGRGLPAGGVTVNLRAGTYEQDSSFTLGAQDSGTAGAPIVYQAYGDEKVTITGSKPVASPALKPVTDPAVRARLAPSIVDSVRQVSLPSQGITDFGSIFPVVAGDSKPTPPSLVIGSDQLTLARYPNTGYSTMGTIAAQTPGLSFTYTDGRPAGWASTQDAWIFGYPGFDWAYQSLPISSVNAASSTVTSSQPSQYAAHAGAKYYYFNVLEELDAPGEWYLDRATGIAYLIPPAGDAKAPLRFTSTTDALVAADGLDYTTFKGLTFADSRGSAISLTNGHHDLITGSTFFNLGVHAADIENGTDVGFTGNTVHDTGAGGVLLNGGDRATLARGDDYADNNEFYRFSQAYPTYSAAVTLEGVGNRVSHNSIHDGPHVAIILRGNDQVIEYNDIHDVVTESSDAGAIYGGRDWTEQGTIIRYNYIHDVGAWSDDTVGVYLDDMMSGTTIYGRRLRERSDVHPALAARYDLVDNNIMIASGKPVRIGTWGAGNAGPGGSLEARLAEVPYQQEPWSSRYPNLLTILQDEEALPKYDTVVRNAYVASGPAEIASAAVPTATIAADWAVADTARVGFVDAAAHDYQLTSKAPIFAAIHGFAPIPFDQIGIVRVSSQFAALPGTSDAYAKSGRVVGERGDRPEGGSEARAGRRRVSGPAAATALKAVTATLTR